MTADTTGRDTGMIDGHRCGKQGWWHPVTIIAHIRGRRMRSTLRQTDTAWRMTVDTRTRHHLRMIHHKRVKQRRRYAVTSFAHITGLRVSGGLADRCCGARRMTSNTAGGNAGVIHAHGGSKCSRRYAMTRIADVRRRWVYRTLSKRQSATHMTFHASASNHLRMIHRPQRKVVWRQLMASVT